MKFLCLFVLIAVAVYGVHAGAKRLCGPVLVQVLESVCIDGYNSLITKKSVPLHNELDVLDMYNEIEDDTPFHSKTSFLDDLLMTDHVNTFAKTRRRRNLLGIYDECCVKGCSLAELTSYCK
ncbi:insulin-like peptide 1 [Cochliomyia hominivorax]